MNTPHDTDERFADWVDERMSARDRERFEAELRVNPALRERAERYRRDVLKLRAALRQPVEPAVDVAARVLANLQRDAVRPLPGAGRGFPGRPLWFSAAAAAVLFAVLLVLHEWQPAPRQERVAAAPAAGAGDEAQRAPRKDAERERQVAAPVAAEDPRPDAGWQAVGEEEQRAARAEQAAGAKAVPPPARPAPVAGEPLDGLATSQFVVPGAEKLVIPTVPQVEYRRYGAAAPRKKSAGGKSAEEESADGSLLALLRPGDRPSGNAEQRREKAEALRRLAGAVQIQPLTGPPPAVESLVTETRAAAEEKEKADRMQAKQKPAGEEGGRAVAAAPQRAADAGAAYLVEGTADDVQAFLARLSELARQQGYEVANTEVPAAVVDALVPAVPAEGAGVAARTQDAGPATGAQPAAPAARGGAAPGANKPPPGQAARGGPGNPPPARVRVVVVVQELDARTRGDARK